MKFLDIDKWNRKEHFHFFRAFEEPFFGLTFEVDCTVAFQRAKKMKTSFFLYYLHKSLHAVHQIECFRYRIVDGNRVAVLNQVNASATILRAEDGVFGFSSIIYENDFKAFKRGAKKEIERIQTTKKLISDTASINTIHYTVISGITFTSFSHARSFKSNDSVPKIAFGKFVEKDGKKMMPVSIHVHHALMDGADVAKYAEVFQELMNEEA